MEAWIYHTEFELSDSLGEGKPWKKLKMRSEIIRYVSHITHSELQAEIISAVKKGNRRPRAALRVGGTAYSRRFFPYGEKALSTLAGAGECQGAGLGFTIVLMRAVK